MGTKQELIDRFNEAVAAFNAAAGDQTSAQPQKIENDFGKFLHGKAVIYPKAGNGPGYHPKEKALEFLLKDCEDHPQFDAKNPIVQVGPENAPGTVGTIHGKAHWYDDKNREEGTGPDDLTFSFTFVDEGAGWLFSTLRATLV